MNFYLLQNRLIFKILICFICLIPFSLFGQSDSSKFDYGIFGIGAEMGPATGMGFIYGESKDFVKNGNFANVAVNFTNKKQYYSLKMGGLSTEIKKDMSYGEDWKEDYMLSSLNFELGFGYHLINSKRFNVIPILSGGIKSINTREGVGDDVIATDYVGMFSASIATDVKFHIKTKEANRYPGYEYTVQYWYIRVLNGICPNYFSNPLKMDGGVYYFNISLGIYYKPRLIKTLPNNAS